MAAQKRKHSPDDEGEAIKEGTIEGLLSWARQNGGLIDNLRIEEREGLRGVTAIESIGAGSEIGRLPPQLILSESTGLSSSFGRALNAHLDAHPEDTLAMTGSTDTYARAAVQFAAFLAFERRRGNASFWAPYLSTLPDDFGLPLQWPSEDVAALLRGTNLQFMATERRRMLSDAIPLIRAAVPDSNIDFDDLAWAYAAIVSRAFPKGRTVVVDDSHDLLDVLTENDKGSGINNPNTKVVELCLYPVLDMINHKRNQKIEWNAEKVPGGISFISPNGVPAGEIVWNNYGSKGNENLLSNYGFVLSPNPEDYAKIALNISPTDPLHHYRHSILSLGPARHISTVHLFFADDVKLSDELLTATRILVGTEPEVESVVQSMVDLAASQGYKTNRDVSRASAKLDLVALSTLYALVSAKVDAIVKGSIELESYVCADKSDLEKERLRMANVYRQGQIAVFKNALRLCQEHFKRVLSNNTDEATSSYILTLRNSKQSGLVLEAVAELAQVDQEGLLDQDTILALVLMHERMLGDDSEFAAFFKALNRSNEEARKLMSEQVEDMSQFFEDALLPFLSQSPFFANLSTTEYSAAQFVWANSLLDTHGITLNSNILKAMDLFDLFDDEDADESIFGNPQPNPISASLSLHTFYRILGIMRTRLWAVANMVIRNRRHLQRWIEIFLVTASILVLWNTPSGSRPLASFESSTDAAMHDLSLDQIVLFGDSITQHSFNPEIQGWGATVAHTYMRKLDVINRGYSGYNTLWAKEILASTIKSTLPPPATSASVPRSLPRIKLMTLFFGANDAVLPDINPKQHVPLREYKLYLHEMLNTIRRESPGTKVLVITPPPIDPTVWGNKCIGKGNQPDRTVAQTRAYRNAVVQVGREAKETWGADLVLVDTWKEFLGERSEVEYGMEEVADLLSDGLHLAAKGNQLLAKGVLKAIAENWPELKAEGLKPRVITHDQVDTDNLPDCLYGNL
ncbi:isoamyl acetate-hydrolyzing esterase [Rhizoclosmatium sp. JEL0117]|nr:isoamyl acetate-hydrolyzing esterase [Rhizoclosmatium sp. JEL0117]